MYRPATCAAGMLALASGAHASPILDATFFDSIPTTLIDFETDGSGGPVALLNGQSMAMPAGAYSSLGVTFDPSVSWVNEGNAIIDGAQALGGSPEIAIPAADMDNFSIEFSVPVRSFGFWVVNNGATSARPTFTAYDAADNPLETVTFDGAAIDGAVGTIEYGFLGITRPEAIARVAISKDFAIFDDLRFSPIPGAGGASLGALSGLALALRRRRE